MPVKINSPQQDSEKRLEVLVLGGYGHFGGRICRRLASNSHISLCVGGRNHTKAKQFIASLDVNEQALAPRPIAIDHSSNSFLEDVQLLKPDLVIHTCGPFQGQDYHVAECCIESGAHYIDLADARKFVCEFSCLDEPARKKRLSLVTGASTLPGLSSAVVSSLTNRFGSIDSIRICIAPGNTTPRGLATIKSVLDYCGRPINWLENGSWITTYGWQNLKRHRFPSLGHRWLGACDVPDLELFTTEYPGVRTVTFHAALELEIWQFGLWLLAWLSRAGIVANWSRAARPFKIFSDRLSFLGTSSGGMFVEVSGQDAAKDAVLTLTWYLTARNGHGPEIPVIPAVILAEKLARGERLRIGAFPCMDEITLDEFAGVVSDLDISWDIQ